VPDPDHRFKIADTRAAAAAVAHLNAIAAADEALDHGDEDVDHPATGLWDGCSSCVAREALAAALPAHRRALAEVLRAAGHAAAADLLELPDS
jgi:hypothetical protein